MKRSKAGMVSYVTSAMACGDADLEAVRSGPQDTRKCLMCGAFDGHLFHAYSRCGSNLHALFLEDSCGSWTTLSGVVDSR